MTDLRFFKLFYEAPGDKNFHLDWVHPHAPKPGLSGDNNLQKSCLLLKHLVPSTEYCGSGVYLVQKQTSTLAIHSARQDEVPCRV